jgi:hypothetical protein
VAELRALPHVPIGAGREHPITPRRIAAAAALAVLLLSVGTINAHRSGWHAPPPPDLSHQQTLLRELIGVRLALAGSPLDLASSGPLLYVLTANPSRLTRLITDPSPLVVQAAPVDADAYKVAIDQDSHRLFVFRHDGTSRTIIAEYDPLGLSLVSERAVPLEVVAVTAFEDRLWLGAANGLYVVDFAPGSLRKVPDIQGRVAGVASSTAGDRVLVATQGKGHNSELSAVQVETEEPAIQRTIPFSQLSMAVVGIELWAAGAAADGTGAALHLNSEFLNGSMTPSITARRAITVWPGNTVIWARTGRKLTCISASDGNTLAAGSTVSGPVVPSIGYAFALFDNSVFSFDLANSACGIG